MSHPKPPAGHKPPTDKPKPEQPLGKPGDVLDSATGAKVVLGEDGKVYVAPPTGQNAGGPQPSGNGPQLPQPTDSGPALCGEPHTYKTSKGEQRTKPCIKAKGHSGLHSSRAQNEKIDTSVVAKDALLFEDVPGDDPDALLDNVTERERSEQQLAIDQRVNDAHKKWLAAGKPMGVNQAIKLNAASRWRGAPELLPAVRKMLQLAESAPINKGLHVKRPPAKRHADGTVMQYFIVTTKAVRPTTAADTPPAAADAAKK